MSTGRQSRSTPAPRTTSVKPATVTGKATGKAGVVDDSDITVTYGIQVTKKTGEFEFLKINAEISVPLTISDEDLARIDKKLIVIREKITDRLADDLREIGL